MLLKSNYFNQKYFKLGIPNPFGLQHQCKCKLISPIPS